jgi:hypothetical protein
MGLIAGQSALRLDGIRFPDQMADIKMVEHKKRRPSERTGGGLYISAFGFDWAIIA